MFLSDLKTGEKGIITKVNGSGPFRKRILEMGFVKGKTVTVILNAPLKDPIKYKIMDYEVSLRRSEAHLIEVIYPEDAQPKEDGQDEIQFDNISSADNSYFEKKELIEKREIKVALVGNPNAGKTSLFNISSGGHEHVGNYGGVTVDSKEGKFKHKGYTFRIVDLPGTYSISAYTPEELYVRKYIGEEKPDVIINVIAASNLERNLYLTTELIDMMVPMVIDLNMYDELQNSGSEFDHKKLSEMIGVPIVPTIAKSGVGISELFDAVIGVYERTDPILRHVRIYYGNTIENSISKLIIEMDKLGSIKLDFPQRYIAIKLLEKDSAVEKYVLAVKGGENILQIRDEEMNNIESTLNEDSESAISNARYGYIAGALKETFKEKIKESDTTRIIDAIVTNKYLGFPLFFLFMATMFICTFILGSYPMDWIENGVGLLSEFVRERMSEGMLKDLLVDGIIGGVGAVIVFLPQIVILYGFISFMEDTGYMARAAFIMDKLMHKMGLHGKSFIPLIMGFGCNVPAIMATRTIESRNSRMITILVAPFMSCNARLPIYSVFILLFIPDNQFYAGLALCGLYFFGMLVAIFSARLFKRFLFKGNDTPFVMELPPYRVPTTKAVIRHMWDKSGQYLRKMGTVILVASIIIWFLGYFPLDEKREEIYENQITQIESQYTKGVIDNEQKEELISEMNKNETIIHQENSYIGRIGKFIEPVMRPLGFDWKVSVSLVTGMSAKEIVVSTLGVLYTGDPEEDTISLSERLLNDTQPDGSKTFTPLVVLSLLIFALVYFPCVATIAAIKKEAGSWKWGLFSVLYTTGLAWILSFLIYQIGSLIIN